MEEDAKVCRVCLKIIEKDIPHSPVTNNIAFYKHLDVLSLIKIKNIKLTEDPVVCDLCDKKLQKLASFKENIVLNELQIQSNQNKDTNSSLEVLYKDIDQLCRLCLKNPEDPVELQKNWTDCIFDKCNIHLNRSIPQPSKICDSCDFTLQSMCDLISHCSENEKHIEEEASKKGNLTHKDLYEIISLRDKVLEKKDIEEDNNNDEEREKEDLSNTNVAGEINLDPNEKTNKALKYVKDNLVEEKEHQENENTVTENTSPGNVEIELCNSSQNELEGQKVKIELIEEEYSKAGQGIETELNNLEESELEQNEPGKLNDLETNLKEHKNESDSNNVEKSSEHTKRTADKGPQISDHKLSTEKVISTDPSSEEPLIFRKTTRTYTRTKPRVSRMAKVIASPLKLNILSDIRLNEPSTSKLQNNETMAEQILGDFDELSESIDVLPLTNIADITLDSGLNQVVEAEGSESDKNSVTQELIELLEGTEEFALTNGGENSFEINKEYKDTEELLRVLEDDGDDVVTEDIQIKERPEKDKKKIAVRTRKIKSLVKNAAVAKKASMEEVATHELSKVKKVVELQEPQNLQISKKKDVKAFVKKTVSKKMEKNAVRTKNTSKTGTVQKRHNLRQKTIVVSFREMLNMKPLKKTESESCTEETDKETDKIKPQESSNSKRSEEESKIQSQVTEKKETVKKNRKNMVEAQEIGISSKQSSSNKVQEVKKKSKDLHSAATVSQIQEVSFEKIQIQEISLVEENTNDDISQTQIECAVKKVPFKREGKINLDIKEQEIAQEVTTSTQQKAGKAIGPVQDVSGVMEKKKGKRRTAVDGQKEVVPKKRAKKLPPKKLSEIKEQPDTNDLEAGGKVAQSPPAQKKQAKKSKEVAKQRKPNTQDHTETDKNAISQEGEEADPDADDSDSSEVEGQSSEKPVVVTIIRRKKTKNKAEREKTWLQLTGAEEAGQVEDMPKRKRGRPRLPKGEKKTPIKPRYYMCGNCPFKSVSQNIIIQHRFIHNIVDDVESLKCHTCGFKTTNKDVYAKHKAIHLTADIVYKCMFCEYVNKKKNSTMYHTLRHNDKDIANMFYCLVLNQITDEEIYECFQCDYQNVEEMVMPDHVIDHQVEKIKNPIMAKFSCTECQYKTKFEDTLKRHQEIHKTQKKHKKVKKEPKVVSTQSPPKEEVLTVYSCDQCYYHTLNRRSLVNHTGLKHTRYAQMNSNAEERPKKREPEPDEIYRCNECDYTTQKKPHLSRHVIIHRSKENMEYYECAHCIFETKHRRSYKRHMEIRHKVMI